MTTKNFKMVLFMSILALMVSCGKDDDDSGPSYAEENFMEGYLYESGFDQIVQSVIDSETFEFGLGFTPLVKGNLTAVRVKLPNVNNTLRVTIWDVANQTVIRTEVVNVSTENLEMTFDVEDLPLVKDQKYAITMNAADWYFRKIMDESEVSYPITVGNIQVDNFRAEFGSEQNFPTMDETNYYAGDLSFSFVQVD